MSGKPVTRKAARLGRLDEGDQAAVIRLIDDARMLQKQRFASRSARGQCFTPRETTNTGADELFEVGEWRSRGSLAGRWARGSF